MHQTVYFSAISYYTVLKCSVMTYTDLGNEVFDDVGRAIIGHVLTVDSDNVGEGLWMVLDSGGQQVG